MLQKEGQIRIPSGCAISGIFSKEKKRMSGEAIIQSIAVMHDRSNGLGGGFAGYGIYPEYKEYYALHIFFDDIHARQVCEVFIGEHFEVRNSSDIPTKQIPAIKDQPFIWRYFVRPNPVRVSASQLDEDEFVSRCVISMNAKLKGVYVFSSGKNMGVFKAVGFPEDVGEFYRLNEYEGHCWIAHGRYPTNTPGWWGGAHPFSMLNYAVVHNGEISSYDANRRYLEMYGYKCMLLTDTEVISYMFDHLNRKVGLSLEEVAEVIAAPFWSTIERMPEPARSHLLYLRNTFASLLVTGPFSILVGFEDGLMALGDRLKLRSMVCGEKGNTFYAASEESAIRRIQPDLDRIWSPEAGEPVIVRAFPAAAAKTGKKK